MRHLHVALVAFAALPLAAAARAATVTVPDDFGTIQAALDAAQAGDTVQVRTGVYAEKLVFPRSGNAVNGYITLTALAGNAPVVDGTGVPGENLVLIEDRSYLKLIGFELRNNLGVSDGSGVRILGAGTHLEIRGNRIHDVRGSDAMGITVYGTAATPISDLVIDGNEIHDCEPFQSEALTLNGNITDFAVTNNVVRDVNNIGIDFIGGETDIQPNANLVARNGICRGNTVLRANQQGGGFAGGIYVDGGRDILIERNLVVGSDLGIEVGAENAGTVTQGITVRDNVLLENRKTGLVFGGFKASVGRVRDSRFLNNTTWHNDQDAAGFGELWIQFADGNTVRNNLFVSTAQNRLLTCEDGCTANHLDYNLFFTGGPGAAEFLWDGNASAGLVAYQAASGQDAHSLLADPLLLDPAHGDVHLAVGSPAVNAGDPAFVPAPGETDLDGAPRLDGARVDLGADEIAACGDGTTGPGEQCDDANPIDGDGCDGNCTVTGCGNRVVTAGEQCDDGNAASGDCCSATCQFESGGGACDDGDLCTNGDSCDGAGHCAGTGTPLPLCAGAPAQQAMLLLKDAANDAGDRLLWKLTHGDATLPAALGDPIGGTGYRLCLYDAAAQPQPRLAATLLSGSVWRAAGSGFIYRSASAAPQGIASATLKPGSAGKTKLLVKGKGSGLPLPALDTLVTPVVVQLRNAAGGCWGATYSAPTRATATQFKSRND
ncbi:MAG: choice-of-anchor Q domain-containing protein [Deltaproteobacteria bacterium]|nr:choice-of-anchor Q domain-containing protein [Deltaproteobacteria bacterium]